MSKKCPKCGNYTLDWKVSFNRWKCVRMNCSYQRKKKKTEVNPHIISVFNL